MASGIALNGCCLHTISVRAKLSGKQRNEEKVNLRQFHSQDLSLRNRNSWVLGETSGKDDGCRGDFQELKASYNTPGRGTSEEFYRVPWRYVSLKRPGLMADREVCFCFPGRRLTLTLMVSFLAWGVPFGHGCVSWAAEEDAKVKYFNNLEEAREAGERRREEKEREQGPVITLPSGAKFRELQIGTGRDVKVGDVLSISYTIYRLNGLYVDSVGYGNEGKDDVGDTFTFTFGSTQIPKAVELGLQDMRVGGKRRILVRPELGWTSPDVQPFPSTGAAKRRVANVARQNLLFEVEIVKAKSLS